MPPLTSAATLGVDSRTDSSKSIYGQFQFNAAADAAGNTASKFTKRSFFSSCETNFTRIRSDASATYGETSLVSEREPQPITGTTTPTTMTTMTPSAAYGQTSLINNIFIDDTTAETEHGSGESVIIYDRLA